MDIFESVTQVLFHTAKQCHISESCNDPTITVQAGSATECCEKGGKSFNDGFECSPACGIIGEFVNIFTL